MRRAAFLRAALFAWALCTAPLLAHAQRNVEVNSAAPDKVAVTLYRDGEVDTRELQRGGGPDGLVLVRETRTVELPAGLSRLKFENVADRIIPQSAALDGLPKGVKERNFDYNLMSPGTLLEKSVGSPVQIVRTNPKTGQETTQNAVIRAAPDGVILEIDGQYEALHCSGAPERLIYGAMPQGFMATPTLSVLVEAAQAGRYTIRLSYLALGLVWSSDYVAKLAPDEKRLDLKGWVTLANRSNTTFADAPVEVVAGNLSRIDGAEPPVPGPRSAPRNCWPISSGRMQRAALPPPPPPPPMPVAMAAPMAEARMAMDKDIELTASKREIAPRDLGDYKLYELPEPTRVAANQIKQVQFLDKQNVPFQRIYRYEIDAWDMIQGQKPDNPRKTASILRLKNDKASNLGLPLPEGRVAIYKIADGDPMFAGGDRAKDVPAGMPWDIEQGQTAEISAMPRVIADKRLSKTRRQVTIEVELMNNSAKAVDAETAWLPRGGFRLVSESKGHKLREGFYVWSYALRAGGSAKFTYTLSFDG
jgi:hypothetical protein